MNRNKKAENMVKSKNILDEYGIGYTEHNNGLHLKIDTGGTAIDFWPSTGKFRHRNFVGRGVFGLIKYIEDYEV